MVDSGAELSLINEDVVERRGIPAVPLEKPLYVVFADQSRTLATRQVSFLPLSCGPWSDSLCCVVVPRLSELLFLGRDWLFKWNPVIDWVTGALTITGAASPWFPKGDEALVEVEADASNVFGEEMSPSAFRKWMRVTSK